MYDWSVRALNQAGYIAHMDIAQLDVTMKLSLLCSEVKNFSNSLGLTINGNANHVLIPDHIL